MFLSNSLEVFADFCCTIHASHLYYLQDKGEDLRRRLVSHLLHFCFKR